MKRYYILPLTGTGASDDPIRPAGVDGLNYACVYDPAGDRALVAVAAPSPSAFAATERVAIKRSPGGLLSDEALTRGRQFVPSFGLHGLYPGE